MNAIQEKFMRGEATIGTFTHLKSAVAIECMGQAGLDYVVIDTEHAPAGVEFVAQAITAADAAGIVPMVRINEISRSAVLQPLDLGAKALIVPAVETPEQVRQLIQYAKFAPLGNRGCCPTRDGGWGFAFNAANGYPAYMANSNRDTMLIPQCETLGCLEHIDEIAAMDGIDGIFVGPLDLSIAMGIPAQLDAPEMDAAFQKILAACKKNNKPVFVFSVDPVTAGQLLVKGFNSITFSLDALMLIQTYRSTIDAVKKSSQKNEP